MLPEGEKTQDEDYHFPVGTIEANQEHFNQLLKTAVAALIKECADLNQKVRSLLSNEDPDIVKKVLEIFDGQLVDVLEPPPEELPFA